MCQFEGQQSEIKAALRRFIFIQVAVVSITALLMLMFQGESAATSALVGGAVGFLTSWIYAKKMIAPQGSETKKVIQAHYKAEAYKLIFTILMFSLVFTQYRGMRPLPLFIGYGASLAVYWVALIFV